MKEVVLLFCFAVLLSSSGVVIAEEVAPDFTLTDIDGGEFSLGDFRGKVVVLDFFATWCGDCVDGIPHLRSLHEDFGEDLVVISISVSPSSDTVELLQQFRQAHQIEWIVTRDTVGISDLYDVQIVPTLVIIDREGYIQHRHVDLTDETVLRDEIIEIIPELGTWISTMFVFLALTLVVVIYKRRRARAVATARLTSRVKG